MAEFPDYRKAHMTKVTFNPWRGACGFYAPDVVRRLLRRGLSDGRKRLYAHLVRSAGRGWRLPASSGTELLGGAAADEARRSANRNPAPEVPEERTRQALGTFFGRSAHEGLERRVPEATGAQASLWT